MVLLPLVEGRFRLIVTRPNYEFESLEHLLIFLRALQTDAEEESRNQELAHANH